MGWSVYILRCRDGTLYTGIAADLDKRLDAHRRGAGAKYTRSRGPLLLAYLEPRPDRSSAQKREAAIRRLGRAGKLALIAARGQRTPVVLPNEAASVERSTPSTIPLRSKSTPGSKRG